jgi:predicted ATPase with chaperone activity
VSRARARRNCRDATVGSGHIRVLRVAGTIADLSGADGIGRLHIADALSYRRRAPIN